MKTSALARVTDLEQIAGGLVTPLGIAEIPDKPVYLTRPETEAWDWVVLRLNDDPVFAAGELAIPRPIRARLRDLERRGAHFDELLIAHEVPRGTDAAADGKPGWELDAVAKVSKARVERSVGRIDRVLGKVGDAATSLVSGIGADPVLIGTIRIDDSPTGRHAWFVLAAWDL